MKRFSIFLLAIVATLSLSSCSEDDDFTFVAKQSPEGVMFLNAPASQYTLSASNGDNIAERFVWNEVDFNVQTPVRYELQASSAESFENFTILASDIAETNYAVSVKTMLELAEEAGLDNDPETADAPNTGDLYFRVRAYVGETAPSNVEEFSEVLALTVVLPENETAEPAKLQLYMVGNASLDNWNNNSNNTPLFRDPADDNIFYYTGYFNAGSFKFLTTLGSWAPMYGVDPNATGTLMYRETEADTDPATIDVTEAGYYSLMVNLNDLTYTFEPYDPSAGTTYTTIGILGDSTTDAWDADQDMSQLSNDPHIWYINDIELTDGEAKFRADNAWDTSWGADTPLSGEATLNGPNIPVTAGIYNVWFNDLTGRYIFIPQVQE